MRHCPTLTLTLALAAALAAGVGAAPAAAATLYKWVDDKGVVHYTEKMPPEAVDKGSVELNRQGIPVKRTEPAPSAEQRRAKQAEEERQKQLAREREIVERRDRALLQSYTSVDEIDLARSRALGTLDSQVQSAQAYSTALVKRREELEAKRKTYAPKPVPAAIDRELESIAAELVRQDSLIAERKRDMAAVTAKYDAEKQRYQEIVASARSREQAQAAPGSGSAAAATNATSVTPPR